MPSTSPTSPASARGRVLVVLAVVGVLALVVAGVATVLALRSGDGGSSAVPGATGSSASGRQVRLPTSTDLLDGVDVARLGGAEPWTITRTDANTSGTGINSRCQLRRFADPQGYAALVRVLRGPGSPRRAAVQTVEVSRSPRQADTAYQTVVGWYADCRAARLRVLTAYRVTGVGDRAELLVLRVYGQPATTLTVAVARTGAVVTSVVASTDGRPPSTEHVTETLSDALRRLCRSSVAGACVGTPRVRAVPPPPAGDGEERGILAASDLPPVGRVDRPWVGTRPASTTANPSRTTCDRATFAAATGRRTRTFVIPQASLPAQFGLSETYGRFRTPQAARAFLAAVRRAVRGCAKRDLAATVGPESAPAHGPGVESAQWRLATKVSGSRTVRFRVGFVRVGRTVAQLTLTPVDVADMTEESFAALVVRAGQRLRELD